MVSTLAFDLGASSGRAVLGRYDGTKLTITEMHRFPNDPVRIHQHMYWDVLRLLHEIKQGLIATRLQGQRDIQSIGIDTWGVDFGLLGMHGELLSNPYHYRDDHTLGIKAEVCRLISQEELFTRTGIQFLQFNTIFQLYALKKAASPLLDRAENLLMMPELLRYFLTGERLSEWSIVSTTQLGSPYTRTWDRELITKLNLPAHLFLEPMAPGTRAGTLLPALCTEVGMEAIPVIAVAEHDTASAVAAVPALEEDFAYMSCGTWSLLGTEISEPIINAQALQENVTNEGGVNGTIRLLKNVTGLWLIQECRRAWKNAGRQLPYTQEIQLIEQAQPFRSFIDPDHPMFVNPLDMPGQIQYYCRQTGQPVPTNEGEILRCIVESLALRYSFVLESIEKLVHKRFTRLHIVGGGAQHSALCQFTANALARPVWAGPREATAIGNVLVQYIALGKMQDLRQARRVVHDSFPIVEYEPVNTDSWEQACEKCYRITRRYTALY
ncbi:rhamnulokinase [Ktedonosporobacter rubrisoli]|uniref:rhamnulokinase n=1 Tax=Ktedonosporobacter rubrisoli TaxID=2509675 RepID=UPI001A926481|nr:rhamnulokinase family protein [Ktedonosporobacter rubrisoli]